MKIAGPERYKLSCDAQEFVVSCSRGTPKFSRLAPRRRPKPYVDPSRQTHLCGLTRQPMRTRLRIGFTATSENGYHGHAWRRNFRERGQQAMSFYRLGISTMTRGPAIAVSTAVATCGSIGFTNGHMPLPRTITAILRPSRFC